MAVNDLRAITVGACKEFKSEIVTYKGKDFLICEPSERQRAEIIKRAQIKINKNSKDNEVEMSTAELYVWALICCVRDPETNEPIYTDADYASLMDMPASQMKSLKEKAVKYLNMDQDEIEKN